MNTVGRVCGTSAAVLLLLFSSAVAVRNWRGERMLVRARAEQKQGNINGARDLYRQALARGRGEAAASLARMAFYRRDWEEVEAYAAQALAADPTDGHVHMLVAYARASGGPAKGREDVEHILGECRRAVSLDPTNAGLWASCADLTLRLYVREIRHWAEEREREQYREEALHAYRRSLRLGAGKAGETLRGAAEAYPDPAFLPEAVLGQDVAAMTAAASLLLERGRWEESRDSWWRVGEASSSPGEFALAAAEALRRKRRRGEALDVFRRYLEAHPDDDHAYFSMGQMAEKMKDREVARKYYLRASSLRPENEAYREALEKVTDRGEN